MIVAFDVCYREGEARTACVGFERWTDDTAALEETFSRRGEAAEYEPGRFYLRELPCLLDAIARLRVRPTAYVVDGYVWLGPKRAGLGAHLRAALGDANPDAVVVGVAKNAFVGAPAVEVLRGKSARPLYVTAAGMDVRRAAAAVRAMHGAHRMPTLLARVDALARGRVAPAA